MIRNIPLLGPQEAPAADKFPDLASFQAAGGAEAYGDGPVWIGNNQYDSRFIDNKLPGFVLVGDSQAAQGNTTANVSITSSGTLCTVTQTSHGLLPGSLFTIQNANESAYNGLFSVVSRIDANTFTYNALSTPSAATATGTPVIVQQQKILDRNWACMANYLSGHKGLYLGNFAQGGSRSSELSRQLDLALSNNNLWGRIPNFVFVCTGINDAINDVLAAVTIANIESAIRRILSFGAIPVVLTIMPLNQSHGSWTSARILESRKVNDWLIKNIETMGAVLIDSNNVCLDRDNQYGNYKNGYSTDGIHINKLPSFLIALEIKSKIFDRVLSVDNRVLTLISPNQTMAGTSGTVAGTGGTGSAANNITCNSLGGGSQTVAFAKGLGISGASESQRMTITAAAALDRGEIRYTSQLSASVVAGKQYIFRARIRCESLPSAFRYIQHGFVITVSGVNADPIVCGLASGGTDSWTNAFDMTIESPPWTAPESGLTSFNGVITAAFQSSGSATFDVSDVAIYQVN